MRAIALAPLLVAGCLSPLTASNDAIVPGSAESGVAASAAVEDASAAESWAGSASMSNVGACTPRVAASVSCAPITAIDEGSFRPLRAHDQGTLVAEWTPASPLQERLRVSAGCGESLLGTGVGASPLVVALADLVPGECGVRVTFEDGAAGSTTQEIAWRIEAP